MPDRRGSRFLVEVLFLLGLSVGLTLSDLSPLEIAGVMLLGWVIVAALEWAAWRSEPHYGSGLPPRYYVPRLDLPPPQPLEQVAAGYPEAARDEAATWIASAALREQMHGEWPMASPAVAPERAPIEVVEAVVDPWLIAELPAAPLGELEPELAPEAQPAAEPAQATDEPEPPLDVVPVLSFHGVARYTLDPLADSPPRRRFGRTGADAPPTVEVPSRPAGVRPLPRRSTRQD